jgi:hypothetical protein
MYLLDEKNELVDAEFSLDLVDAEHCIVVESSGGSNPTRGVKRRNPEYNRLLSILFSRLAQSKVRIARVVLDSAQVATVSVTDRIAELDTPYPVDLSNLDVEEFRKMLGRKIAAMHRDPRARQGGNAQKRIRICLECPVRPEQLVSASAEQTPPSQIIEYAPGLDETEREYLRSARIGQGGFRKALLKQFGEACPVTGITNPELLIASHIKPWSACSNSDRLDSQNGLLLSALVDRLFDRGLISFSDGGQLMVSPKLSESDWRLCNLCAAKPIALTERSKVYMAYHREIEFVST